MKELIIISFYFCAFIQLSFSQNPIPDFKNGKIEIGQVYGLIKWTVEEVMEMDSFIRPNLSSGGVLVDANEFYLVQDTILVADISNIDSNKLITITKRGNRENYTFNRWEFGWDTQGKYFFENLILFQKFSIENIFPLRIVKMSLNYEDEIEYQIKDEYKNEYPNGLPQKMEIRKYSKKKDPYWIILDEWKLLKENKSLEKSGNVYFGENNESYWLFEPGYYSWWGRMVKNQNPSVTEIQEALIRKGYDIEVTGELNSQTKAALTKFQKENGVPNMCGWQNEILRALGIEY